MCSFPDHISNFESVCKDYRSSFPSNVWDELKKIRMNNVCNRLNGWIDYNKQFCFIIARYDWELSDEDETLEGDYFVFFDLNGKLIDIIKTNDFGCYSCTFDYKGKSYDIQECHYGPFNYFYRIN